MLTFFTTEIIYLFLLFSQIQYLFCDKTGTLTENKMLFKRCTIGGHDFTHNAITPTINKEVLTRIFFREIDLVVPESISQDFKKKILVCYENISTKLIFFEKCQFFKIPFSGLHGLIKSRILGDHPWRRIWIWRSNDWGQSSIGRTIIWYSNSHGGTWQTIKNNSSGIWCHS